MFTKKIKIFLLSFLTISIIFVIFSLVPVKYVVDYNPFISTTGMPMLCAHRGGSISNPENTLLAYDTAVGNYGVDILETDLWITKDEKNLVLNHDGTLDRTSDYALFTNDLEKNHIRDYTLDELKNFNFGYNFQDKNGNYPYKNLVSKDDPNRKEIIANNRLSIVTLDELLAHFYDTNKDLLFIVEIKDSGDLGKKAADLLDEMLTTKFPDYKNRLVVGTFHPEIEDYLQVNHSSLYSGASTKGATNFILSELFGVNRFLNNSFVCLQLPLKQYGVNLTLDCIIRQAHRKNIAVQYWTINDESTMRRLIKKSCDAIMTDDPELLRNVLDSYNS